MNQNVVTFNPTQKTAAAVNCQVENKDAYAFFDTIFDRNLSPGHCPCNCGKPIEVARRLAHSYQFYLSIFGTKFYFAGPNCKLKLKKEIGTLPDGKKTLAKNHILNLN